MNYKTKLIEVQAIVWDGNTDTANRFIGERYNIDWYFKENNCLNIMIGDLLVWAGDWILKHNDGTFTTLNDDEFKDRFQTQ